MTVFILITAFLLWYFIRKGQRAKANGQTTIINNQPANLQPVPGNNSFIKTAGTSFLLAWCIDPMLGKKSPGVIKLGILGMFAASALKHAQPAPQPAGVTVDAEVIDDSPIKEHAVQALITLGFNRKNSEAAVAKVTGSNAAEIIKNALKYLRNQ